MAFVRTGLRRTQMGMAVILFASGCMLGLNCGGNDSGQAGKRLRQTFTVNGVKVEGVVDTTTNSFGVPAILNFDAKCPNGAVSIGVPVNGTRTDTVAATNVKARAVVINTENKTLVFLQCPGSGNRLEFAFDKAKIKKTLGKLDLTTTTTGTTTTTTTTTTESTSESTATATTETSP
jgi:hypothetical protein